MIKQRLSIGRRYVVAVALASAFSCVGHGRAAASFVQQSSGTPSPAEAPAPGVLRQEELKTLLPETVFFRGKTAATQLRNAGGMRFADGSLLLAAMVDSSGYATAIQDSYQMYLLTDTTVVIAGQVLPPGAYGGGMVSGHLLLMDLSGAPVLKADAQVDEQMARPRPLQILADSPDALKLYMGRRWVRVTTSHAAAAQTK